MRSLRWFLCAPVLASLVFSIGADAQTFFYNEVARGGRIYVFASASRFETFTKGAEADGGATIERAGYGPNGETVVFDSQDAINLYNFKHGLPGESFAKPEETTKSEYPFGKFSGLMFGDYYWYFDRHQDGISFSDPTPVEGQHGLWFRRIYFTYDFTYNDKLTTRFRLEANSNGDFTGGDLTPYVKDAYLKWTYAGSHEMSLGIHPTITFDWLDGFWGLRHIEKTPADLYRLDSSRDFGFTFDGPTPIDGLGYSVQFGNESGNGSETQEGKILRAEGRYEKNSTLALEGFYSLGTRPNDEHRQTAQGIVGYRTGAGRVGGQYLWQQRRSGLDDVPHQRISVWSGFGVWDFLPKKATLFLRADSVAGQLGDLETGLPGAEGIDYWLLSSHSPFTTWIFGGEWYLHSAVRLSPNLEIVRYADEPDPVNNPGRRQDAQFRLTFFWAF